MDYNQIVDYLLEKASVNIKYRVKRDILAIAVDSDEMKRLQDQILGLPRVKKTFLTQQENGLLGNELHGGFFNGIDTNVSFLLRNGVETSNPFMIKAKNALLQWTDFEKDSFYRAGHAMDECGRGGFKAIIADVLFDLGCGEDTPQIKEQIDMALRSFQTALNYSSINDFSKECAFQGRKSRYYIDKAFFPASNHLKMLAKTKLWRSESNLAMVIRSYRHCKELMKHYEGSLYVNCGHYVGPFNIDWHSKEIQSVSEFAGHPINFAWWMKGMYFSNYSLFDPPMDKALTDWIYKDDITAELPDGCLKQFKNYVSIEPFWRKKESVSCDLYFPAILSLSACKKRV